MMLVVEVTEEEDVGGSGIEVESPLAAECLYH
jgi:hypothetical protein